MDALPLPMSGMLVKKGRRRKNWKVRFFYMLGSHLQYFEYENSGKPLGQAIVTGVYDVPDRAHSRSLFAPQKIATNRFDIVCVLDAEEPPDTARGGAVRPSDLAALGAPIFISVYGMTTQDKARWLEALARASRQLPLREHPRLAQFCSGDAEAVAGALRREARLELELLEAAAEEDSVDAGDDEEGGGRGGATARAAPRSGPRTGLPTRARSTRSS